ncbi:cellulase family glycosylhydrolase [bacterium 3DAC]|nr:glycoside hydrolase family 5 protein [Dictyoglomota bacterium]UZN22383.1 cellulase family glycosylhydrolase [bacterium 3DAC]
MKICKSLSVLIAIVMLVGTSLPTMTSVSAQTLNTPISPIEYQRMLGIGINVDWVTFQKWRKGYTATVALDFKKIGFQHVRIRVADDSTQTIALLHRVVNDCFKVGLIPIIAYAAKDFNRHPSQETLKESVAFWSKISEEFKDYPYLLSYDMIIEVGKELNNYPDLLNEFYKQVIPTIRKVDPYRIIFISPRYASNPYYLDELYIPPGDNYIMGEWHFYAAGPNPKIGTNKQWTTGTPYEKSLIWNKIEAALSWQKKTGLRTWVGAWMPGNYNKGDTYSIGQQINFASYMSCSLLYARIPFAINADGQFYDIEHYQWRSDRYPVLMAVLYPCHPKGKMLWN